MLFLDCLFILNTSQLGSSKFILYSKRKNHSISSQDFCPCIMTTIASSHSSNILSIGLFHFSYSVQSSLFHYSNWPLLRQFLVRLKIFSFFQTIRILLKFHRDYNPSCRFWKITLYLFRIFPEVQFP